VVAGAVAAGTAGAGAGAAGASPGPGRGAVAVDPPIGPVVDAAAGSGGSVTSSDADPVAPSGSSTTRVVRPITTRSPMCRYAGPERVEPFNVVPVVLPRSLTARPSGVG
jgi:hypothetical protein